MCVRVCIESRVFKFQAYKADSKSTFVSPGEPIRAARGVAGVGCEAAGRTRVLSVRCCSPAGCLMCALLSEAPPPFQKHPSICGFAPLSKCDRCTRRVTILELRWSSSEGHVPHH